MRARLIPVWTLSLLALGRATLVACSCLWSGPFLTVGPQQELVIRGKVVSYTANGMNVEVHETLKGETEAASIRIWGDNGILCRPYVTSFPLGTEWVLAVSTNRNDAEGSFEISACGDFALKVEKETVSGRITGNTTKPGPVETMSLAEFRGRLRAAVR